MKKEELPETLFIPCQQIPMGTVDFQPKDNRGKFYQMVWGTLDKAIDWLENGGRDAYLEHDKTAAQNVSKGATIGIRKVDLSDYLMLTVVPLVHFEPELGGLVAPEDRRVEVQQKIRG